MNMLPPTFVNVTPAYAGTEPEKPAPRRGD
jgi:hypothetical protein